MEDVTVGTVAFAANPRRRRWLLPLCGVTLVLVLASGLLKLGINSPALTALLRPLTLAVENNLGAWWSSMLLLLGALHAYDGRVRYRESAPALSHAWGIVAAILLFLSFDEASSTHERLMDWATATGIGKWTPVLALGTLIGAAFLWALTLMLRAGQAHRRIALTLFIGFCLLGSVAVQEYLEHRVIWIAPVAQAIRVMLEEGAEVLGMLVLVRVASDNTAPFARSAHPGDRPTFAALNEKRTALLFAGLLLAPAAAILTDLVDADRRGRPSDWIAATAFALAALATVRPVLAGHLRADRALWATVALCLVASGTASRWMATDRTMVLGSSLDNKLAAVCIVFVLIAILRGLAPPERASLSPVHAACAGFALALPFIVMTPAQIYLAAQGLACLAFAFTAPPVPSAAGGRVFATSILPASRRRV